MEIIGRDAVAPFTTKDTSTIRELLNPRNTSARQQSLAEATVEVGQATVAHYHPHTEEIYYLLQGEAVMAIEAEQSNVHAGDAILIPAGMRHQIRNTGNEPLIVLCCCAPAYTDEDTLLCASLLSP